MANDEKEKAVEFYAASVAAWYDTALEHDKSVLALAAGGIGLLVTLLTTQGVTSLISLALYILSIVCFLVSIGVILFIFKRNRTHIEALINKPGARITDPMLERLDEVAFVSFAMGVLFSAAVGVSVAITSFNQSEKVMTDEKTTSGTNTAPLRESVNGVANLQPAVDFTKSFSGVSNLQPQAPAPSSTPAPAATTPSSPPVIGPSNESGKK